MLWTQCLRSLSDSKGLCHVDWAFTEAQRCGPYSQHGRVGSKILIFWYSIQYIAEFIGPFPSETSAPAPGMGDEWCPVAALCSAELRGVWSQSLGSTQSQLLMLQQHWMPSLFQMLPGRKDLTEFSNSYSPSGDQGYGLWTPVRWCLAPSPWFPSSCVICEILAFLSSFPSPSPTSVHTACFRTPSLCPPLLLMFDKRKCVMPDKHIPVPNCLGLF